MATLSVPVQIAGTGSYLPERVLTNQDLERMVETTDEWIVTRTGIRERRIASDRQATSDLATEAARKALKDAGVKAEDLDLIIVATVTPDMAFPATACYVQFKLGAKRAVAFDISAACSGFLYAMDLAAAQIAAGAVRAALIIGAEKLSTITNWKDRNTCVLFGDGAGAAVLTPGTSDSGRILSCVKGTDGAQTGILKVPGSGTAAPDDPELEPVEGSVHGTIYMAGREVFKHAVTAMKEAAVHCPRRGNLRDRLGHFAGRGPFRAPQERGDEADSLECLGVVAERRVKHAALAVIEHHQHRLVAARFLELRSVRRRGQDGHVFGRTAQQGVAFVLGVHPEVGKVLGDRMGFVAHGDHEFVLRPVGAAFPGGWCRGRCFHRRRNRHKGRISRCGRPIRPSRSCG
jgi:3-oxoacyl-[acyl-carrier-protein] synthase III